MAIYHTKFENDSETLSLLDKAIKTKPDYYLYGGLGGMDFSLGYTFRPCFRRCSFCKVPLLDNPDISIVLTGARSVEEVEQNVSSVEKGALPADVLSRLQEIADMVPFRPYEEPFGLPFGRPYRGPGHA